MKNTNTDVYVKQSKSGIF